MVQEGDRQMNANSKISKKSKPMITAATLFRLAGLSAIVAGLCFIMIGIFHPVNASAYVTTPSWVIAHIFAFALGFFGLLGLAGLYARQVEESGWLGLAGFVVFGLWMTLMSCFTFMEAFILPRLVTESPLYAEGILGMFTGAASQVELGILPTLWTISNPMYLLGLLLFGIATFRAGVLPRWAGALLAFGLVLVPVGAIVPPEHQSKILLPVGLALAWLGYALFSERREKTSETVLEAKTAKAELSEAA
jgi:hypothetical protein